MKTEDYEDRSVTTEKLHDEAVTERKLAEHAVTSSILGNGAVENSNIKDGSISSEKLEDGSVTNEKLAVNSITKDKLKDRTIGVEKLDTELRQMITAATGLTEELVESIQNVDETVSEHTKQIESNQSQITANKSAQDEKNISLEENMKKLNVRDDQITESLKSIAASGGASVATAVTYDNTSSQLVSATVQSAVDELQSSKINKTSISQESGDSEEIVMSQKAVSNNLSKINYYVNRIKKGIPNVTEEGFHVADESGNVGLKYDNLGLDAAKLSKHLKELIKNIDGIGENQYTRETAESGYYLIDSEGNIVLSYTSDGLNIAKGSANLKKIVKNSDGFLGGLSTMYNGKNPYGLNANKYYVDAIRRTIASDDNVIPFILIAGQSNAVGAAPINTVPISYKDSIYRVNNYYIWNPDKKTFATFNFSNNNGMSGGNSWKFGFDPFFAESYINYYGKPIYGVKVARGGTAIGLKKGAASFCWNADIKMVEDAGVTSMCRLLLTTISDIKTWARDNNKVLMPLAVLWLQGETDAVYGFQDVYQTNCSEVFSFIRGALGCPSLPIINSPIELNTIKERVTINNAFTTMNGIDDYFKTIDISDFEQGESTEYPTYEMSQNYDFNYRGFDYHFLTRGYQRIGQRMFNIFKELNK